MFPHIVFNLPKDNQLLKYQQLHSEAIENLLKQKVKIVRNFLYSNETLFKYLKQACYAYI